MSGRLPRKAGVLRTQEPGVAFTVEVSIRDLVTGKVEKTQLAPGEWQVVTAAPLGVAYVATYPNGNAVVTLKREEAGA